MICTQCHYQFPDHLVAEMCVAKDGVPTYARVCAICALRLTNKLHGTDRTDFAPGSKAQQMLVEARRIVESG